MGEKNKDCRFYSLTKGTCTALKDLYCALEDKPCSFYKPRTLINKPNEKDKGGK